MTDIIIGVIVFVALAVAFVEGYALLLSLRLHLRERLVGGCTRPVVRLGLGS
jgi:hypothetical protein